MANEAIPRWVQYRQARRQNHAGLRLRTVSRELLQLLCGLVEELWPDLPPGACWCREDPLTPHRLQLWIARTDAPPLQVALPYGPEARLLSAQDYQTTMLRPRVRALQARQAAWSGQEGSTREHGA